MKENSIEEYIKSLEDFSNESVLYGSTVGMTLEKYKDLQLSTEHILSDYKKVLKINEVLLKENEELKEDRKNNNVMISLAQNELLNYMSGYEDGKKHKMTAMAQVIENQQYYIVRKQMEKYEERIKMLQKENEELKRNYVSVDFLLEKYLIELNAQNKKVVNVNIQDINNLKAYILQLIDEFKKKNPMEQVKGANFVLFNDIIQYFHHNESDKFDEAINQLAIEMKNLQDTLFEKEKNSKRQDVLTIVGLVLSVLFGIMTFIQFFI